MQNEIDYRLAGGIQPDQDTLQPAFRNKNSHI